METFTHARRFVDNPRFAQDRRSTIAALDLNAIDAPIVDIISSLADCPHCFPLQSCFGHFVCAPDQDRQSLAPIPSGYAGNVEYRIAYIALCIENSHYGRVLRGSLARIPEIDTAFIQFGSADWFWDQFANSYVLQVEPRDHMGKDEAILDAAEARHVLVIRNRFFRELRNRMRR